MKKNNGQFNLNCDVISPGIIYAPICHYQSGSSEPTAFYKLDDESIEPEIKRLNQAIENSKLELSSLALSIEKMIGKNEAKIFETHILLLEDKNLLDKLYNKIRNEKINIEHAVIDVFEEFEEIFAQMDDEYLKDRGTDFSEIKRRLLNHLTGEKGKYLCDESCYINNVNGKIIASKDFTSSMISLLKDDNIKGFITEIGSKNSHAAILARAAGIPFVTGINVIEKIKCGSIAIIDCNNKQVIFNPSPDKIDEYEKIIENEKNKSEIKYTGPIIKTKNNIEIELFANIMNPIEISFMNKYNLSGIGLLRTEFLFMNNKKFPTMEEQSEVYSKIINDSKDKTVVFRLFDLGGDKRINSLKFADEENPLLGLRGIRYLMKHKNILKDQLEAIIITAKRNNIKILYPMISNIDELIEVNNLVKEILKKHNKLDLIKTGMMFEVPSVFINPVPFLEQIDFISIGSNDLVQYLFGVDRNNPFVSYLYNQDNQIIYNLLKTLIKETEKRKIDTSLCGEIDLSSNFLEKIIKLGIRKISIAPIAAAKIIDKIQNITN